MFSIIFNGLTRTSYLNVKRFAGKLFKPGSILRPLVLGAYTLTFDHTAVSEYYEISRNIQCTLSIIMYVDTILPCRLEHVAKVSVIITEMALLKAT